MGENQQYTGGQADIAVQLLGQAARGWPQTNPQDLLDAGLSRDHGQASWRRLGLERDGFRPTQFPEIPAKAGIQYAAA